jgi:hypothetical protein
MTATAAPERIKRIKMRPYQSGFMRSSARFPAMVSAWGTGKTMFGILKVVSDSEKYENNQWLVVRKEFTRLEDSTIPDFERYTGLKVGSDKNVKLDNGSLIMFRHGDQINNSDVLQNMNLGGFLMEQAEEFDTENEFQMCRGRLRREGVPHRGIVIANTKGHNWVWKLWKAPNPDRSPDYELYEATSFDNAKNLPADTIADWRSMEKDSPHIFNRFILNSWDDVDTEEKVLPYSWIKRAIKNTYRTLRTKTIEACDPCGVSEVSNAGDEGVIYIIQNGGIIAHDFFRNKQPDQIAARCQTMRRDYKAGGIVVDPIGVGSGVMNWLSKMGEKVVISAHSAQKSESREPLCYNKRAEFWWVARDQFREGMVSIPDDPILIEELSQVGYELTPRGYKIESKDELKKADRLGRSPNRADCLIYGLWGLTKIDYDSEAIYLDEYNADDDANSTAMSYATKTAFD